MEFVYDLLVSASLALLLSFLVAKLVSMAMASDADCEVEASLGLFARKLAVQGFGSEEKVESVVRSAEAVDKFLVEQYDVGPTEENVCFHGKFHEKPCESLEISSCDRLGENFECDALPKNTLEGPILSEMAVENSSNSNSEGHKEPNEDVIGDHMRHNTTVEEIEEEDQKHVLQPPIAEEDNEEDDDDWEDIERTELEKVFAAASRFVSEEDGLENAGNELKMEFYGLHKVATEGPCRESQPMALQVSSRAKWPLITLCKECLDKTGEHESRGSNGAVYYPSFRHSSWLDGTLFYCILRDSTKFPKWKEVSEAGLWWEQTCNCCGLPLGNLQAEAMLCSVSYGFV